MRAKFSGPYTIERKVNDLNYVVATPDRRKSKRLCHVNMLKRYFERQEKMQIAFVQRSEEKVDIGESNGSQSLMRQEKEMHEVIKNECNVKLENSDVLKNLSKRLSHIDEEQRREITALIHEYKQLFSDVPGLTQMGCHDVDVGESAPVKQHPYRVNPKKREMIEKEIEYMLEKK